MRVQAWLTIIRYSEDEHGRCTDSRRKLAKPVMTSVKPVVPPHRLSFERPTNCPQNGYRILGLLDHSTRFEALRVPMHKPAWKTGEKHEFQAWPARLECIRHFDSVLSRHADIENHEIGVGVLDGRRHASEARASPADFDIVLIVDERSQSACKKPVVIDDKNALRFGSKQILAGTTNRDTGDAFSRSV